MGSSQSQKEKIKQEVINNTEIQMKLKKVNDSINETTAKVVNKISEEIEVKSKTTMKQKVGDLDFSGSKDSEVKIGQDLKQAETIKITSIQNIKQDSKVVNDLQKQIQSDLQKGLEQQQSASASDSEKMMSELMGAISGVVKGAMQSVTGGKSVSDKEVETAIKNELKINNETEIVNKTKNVISSEMITESLNKLSTDLETFMEQEIGNIKATDAEKLKLDFTQKAIITRDVFMEKLNDTGMGSTIMSKILEVDETKVKEGIKAAQEAENKEKGTLESAGEGIATAAKGAGEGLSQAASGVGKATGGFLTSLVMPLIVIGVVGVAALFIAKPLLSKGIDKYQPGSSKPSSKPSGASAPSAPSGPKPSYKLPPLKKGGKMPKINFLNNLINMIKKSLKKIFKIVTKFFTYSNMKKYMTKRNLIIILSLIFGYLLFKSLFGKKENFEVNKNYKIKVDGKFVKRNDGMLSLVDSMEDASEVTVLLKNDKVFLNFGNEFSVTNLSGQPRVLPNKPIFYLKQMIDYNNKKLKIDQQFLSVKDDKLVFDEEGMDIEFIGKDGMVEETPEEIEEEQEMGEEMGEEVEEEIEE